MRKQLSGRERVLVLATSAAISLSAGSVVLGANKTYIGPAGGNWNTSSYWMLPGVPAAGDWAFFQPTGSGSYTYDGSYSVGAPLGSLILGNGGSSAPTLNQSSGTLNVGTLSLESGTFNQTAGVTGIADTLYIFDAGSGADEYKLTGGTLTAGFVYVGYSGGAGTFIQRAGSGNIGSELYVGSGTSSSGTISLTGGTLAVGSTDIGSNGGNGTYLQAGTRSFSSLGSSLIVGDGTTATGMVSLLDGTLTASEAQIGYGGTGTFSQSGGSSDLGSELDVGSASFGTVSLSGGVLQSNTTFVGEFGGAGTFLQSDGLGNLGTNVHFGDGTGSTGVASLSGGALFAALVVVGNNGGSGTFLQSGSLTGNNIGTSLVLGEGTGATGFASLSGGTMTSPYLFVGYSGGTGTFLQSAGSSSFKSALYVGYSSGSSGTLLLSGGSMVAAETIVGGSEGAGTFVQSGSLTVSSLGTLTVASTSAISLSGGTMDVSRIISSGAINVGGGRLAITSAGTLGTGGLASIDITDSGVVDVGSSGLVIAYGNNPSPIGELTQNGHSQTYPAGSIQRYIQSAYDGGLWDGPGLTSTNAANDPIGLTAVGALDQNDLNNAEGGDYTGSTWMGVSITSDNTVLVRYTYYGDTDLDGFVGPSDVNNLELGYAGVGDGWLYGDFNYDGVVNFNDVNLLDLNYENVPLGDVRLLTAAQSKWLLAASKGLTPSQIAAFEARVAVPEPASIGLIGAATIGLLGRRRRRASDGGPGRR
jgi:hypothetical protein